MLGAVVYRPQVPVPRRDQFPETLRDRAERVRLEGVGTDRTPIVMGWVVRTHGRPVREVFDHGSKDWLRANGFQPSRNGQKWTRPDRPSGVAEQGGGPSGP
ncbi:hypothetical protein [Pseudoxanthomonas kaohsiungensis]|uniref:Uncharacterized protein n=1 Tax=Pseudoxanthomonas kaohsiungensis TaxID=283923 RepID=A0ABW3LY03_9GAMM|nr:hypothetical protein [Pseudoxanthomonas kaohsiungensis]KAF1702993.1 hypothetical protein CSC66_09470 [Pseudoxanthomonas kaohsiungensis]